MIYLWRMGVRNIWKNRRRSAATILAIAIGFAAINLFAGYINNVYTGLQEQAIHGERLGHLMIVKRGMFQEGHLSPGRYLFDAMELERIGSMLYAAGGVTLVTPRLDISGIVSNGRVSTIFISEGLVPVDLAEIRGSFDLVQGSFLDPENPIGVAMAQDLAASLGLSIGDGAVLLTTTAEGMTNALDIDVVDIFNTGIAGTNDKFLLQPLHLAQRLFDTDGADRLVVLLDDVRTTDSQRVRLNTMLAEAGFDLEIRSWRELSVFYGQVKALFDVIFLFISAIVILVVIMSVVNTMSMAVVERTREIGTLRALGMKRGGIARLFSLEGLTLALVGCASGFVLTLLLAAAVNYLGISYVPPNSSHSVPLQVDLDPRAFLSTALVLATLAGLSAFVPARAAARREIVNALGHA